jgi:putative FmdB family regulatory protein
MPTYDYICSNCGRTTEVIHPISGGSPVACPACGAVGTLRKAFNPPTIHFKGSGWAKKDRSSGHSRPARSGDAASANGSGGEHSSDSSHGQDGDGGGGDARPEPVAAREGKDKDGGRAEAPASKADRKSTATTPSPGSGTD